MADRYELPRIGVYHFRGGELLAPENLDDAAAALPLPDAATPMAASETATVEAVAAEAVAAEDVVVPLVEGDAAFVLRRAAADQPLPPGWRSVATRTVWMAAAAAFRPFPAESAAAMSESNGKAVKSEPFLRACHLDRWLTESLYCGRCGAPNSLALDEFARLCPSCGRREYPRISPAVIVLIDDGEGRLLLAHNHKFRSGIYSLLAGFVEAGETLEQAVRREVAEEVGIKVAELRYAASQPWPFPDSLMIGFRARGDGGELHPDGIEISDAGWYRPEALPALPTSGSVARAMIDHWLAEQSAKNKKTE